ncbi:hypothetical protein [Methylobacterium platani]|uniref:Yip1 domain-containing protein n=2 Tax=Methylobacterium platani TaxID=427683 RepID=A0A179SAX9_9HYPH|nr:hypothetical protein [Methylobacterium platani]KMO21808.1 hypothetical protein SQ03_02280 [Methylobacterium platani JCM 14648]OAS24992.1 hypothetical protein A5481_11845 [Methylobacterium platani]
MFVSADDLVRSLRATLGLIGRRPDALRHLDVSERGFWRSFGAVWLTAPAATVALTLERGTGAAPFQLDHVTAAVLIGLAAAFLPVPLAMVGLLRRLDRPYAYVPFVVVTNWLLAAGLAALALPGCLLALGLATPGLAALEAGAFAVVLLWLHGRAARAILGLPGPAAALVTLACFGLIVGCAGGAHALV